MSEQTCPRCAGTGQAIIGACLVCSGSGRATAEARAAWETRKAQILEMQEARGSMTVAEISVDMEMTPTECIRFLRGRPVNE